MNIAFFGGVFDPIHIGHLRAARVACRRLRLDRVLFVPSGYPPHKRADELAPFVHRFAMTALACAGEPKFVPSLLEAPGRRPHYSVETTRALIKTLGAGNRLYFLIGADAFLDLPQWREPQRLLDQTDFIVVSRPGFHIRDVMNVIPKHMVNQSPRRGRPQTVRLRRSTLHVLSGVHVPVASSDLRAALRRGEPVTGLLPPLVEEYIMKEGVYRL
ncbi:MAG: nicotinate (nicotinamide) nucleotide adenylyltransferase [Terriglobia bacterium]